MLEKIMSNFQSPKNNIIGRLLLRGMNIGHRQISRWTLSQLPRDAAFTNIIDIGCGGGWTLSRLLKRWSKANVVGIDVAEASVAKSLDYNAEAVSSGRCNVVLGNVASMPFPDGHFDAATAIETVYFWDPLDDSLREVRRCLKEGGWFVVGLEAGKKGQAQFWSRHVGGMHPYDAEYIKARLLAAGFRDVEADQGMMYARIVARK